MFFQKNKLFAGSLTAICVLALSFFSCVKTDFDQPPVGGDGMDIPTNATIAEIKALHETSGGYDRINDDLVIGGVVVMDDRSGNYYKTLVIQDSTGGIEVKFSNGYLYNRYPVGRKIYIRCQGLVLGDYNKLIQLSGGTIEENGQVSDIGLTENQERTNIVKGFLGDAPTPTVVGINQLNANLVSTLVKIEGVEFTGADSGETYADALTLTSLNRTFENCAGVQLILRTSGFSDFAIQKTPTGKGSITGVLGIFGSTYQLYIRDTTDVDMNGPRCGAGSGNETLVNLSDVRALFQGSTTYLPSDRKIKGIVISDRTGNNLNNRNLYIQDGTAGIVLRFEATHSFDLGDELEVVVSDIELSEFNQLMQINNIPLAAATKKSSGNTVTPRLATVAEINANFEIWESTLVKITNASITGGATLAGSRDLSDGTGTIILFTSNSATFSGMTTPSGPVTLTGILSDYNANEVLMRNANDIQ
ncbi:MAG: DUF5689 domain-containing protein [Saprospiraceae bacterium]